MKNDSNEPEIPDDEAPFGLRFYRTLRKLAVPTGLNYEDIQRLKQADRTETTRIFSNAGYAILQVIKEHDPEQAAIFARALTLGAPLNLPTGR